MNEDDWALLIGSIISIIVVVPLVTKCHYDELKIKEIVDNLNQPTQPSREDKHVPKPPSQPQVILPELPLVPAAYDIPTLETTYRNKQQAYNKHLADFNKAKQQAAELENTTSLAPKTLSEYQAKMNDALAKLKKAQERMWDNPELSIEQERIVYRQAKMAFEGKNNELKQLQTELAQAKKDVEAKQAALKDTQNEINRLKRQLHVGYFAHFKAKVEKEKIVEGYGEAGCNEQRPIVECKEIAKLAALKDASEKGSIIVLDSETQVIYGKGEWKLTKDEISTQLRAVVIGHEVLDDNVMGKGSAYYYKIRATIKGQVPPKLQRQLLGQ